MSKILITGANSQLGQALVKRLGDLALPKTREQLDIANKEQVDEAISSLRPTFVINTARASHASANDVKWAVNAAGVDNLIKASAQVGAKFITFSSDGVFSGARTTKKMTEDDPIRPITWTGIHNAQAEHAVLRIGQCMCPDYWASGFRYWVIRTSVLFDHHAEPGNNSLAHRFISQAKATRSLKLPADHQISFTYVPHLAKAVAYLVKKHNEFISGIYHVTNSGSCSAYQFAEHLSRGPERFEVQPMPVVDYKASAGLAGDWAHANSVVLSNDKFINDAGGPTLPDWQEAIEEFWNGYPRD